MVKKCHRLGVVATLGNQSAPRDAKDAFRKRNKQEDEKQVEKCEMRKLLIMQLTSSHESKDYKTEGFARLALQCTLEIEYQTQILSNHKSGRRP